MHYKQNLIDSKGNLSKTWKIVNEIINKTKVKTNIPSLATSTNASNPLDTVNTSNILDGCFVEIGPTLASSIPPTAHVPYTSGSSVIHSIFLSPVLPEDVFCKLICLNPSKSNDTYEFPVSSLKLSKHVIAPYFADLYNLCITDSVFPTRLKLLKEIPVDKSGDKSQPSNHRPLSLLSHFSKIFEKLVSTNLLSFLAQFNILCHQQFGFRQGLSTPLALLKLQDHILEQNYKNLFTCAILLDLKKAFDTVDHQKLLGKLNQYGLKGSTNKFFESYLSKRQQIVYVNHIKSNTKYVTCSVPQGSTLCPILFYSK